MPTTSEDGELLVEDWTVPGLHKDKYGNTWTIPSDELAAEDLIVDRLKLPSRDPDMYYEFVGPGQLQERLTDQFVRVRREEVGIADAVVRADPEGGTPLDSYHQVGDLSLLKIPKVLEQRRRRAQKRINDAAVAEINDPKVRAERLVTHKDGTTRNSDLGEVSRVAERSPEPTATEAVRRDFMPRLDRHTRREVATPEGEAD